MSYPQIASALLSPSSSGGRCGIPVQGSLLLDFQLPKRFALRLHQATRLHYDFRMQIGDTLFSLALPVKPSLNPGTCVVARLMADHNPKHLISERRIPDGFPGAGPTMPVDTGTYLPIGDKVQCYDAEALRQLRDGDFRFELSGRYLKGGWQLLRVGHDRWAMGKLLDEHASETKTLDLSTSINSGHGLADIELAWLVDTQVRSRSVSGLWN